MCSSNVNILSFHEIMIIVGIVKGPYTSMECFEWRKTTIYSLRCAIQCEWRVYNTFSLFSPLLFSLFLSLSLQGGTLDVGLRPTKLPPLQISITAPKKCHGSLVGNWGNRSRSDLRKWPKLAQPIPAVLLVLTEHPLVRLIPVIILQRNSLGVSG